MTNALAAMPGHLRKRLVHSLDTGALVAPYSPSALQMALGDSDPMVLAALERLAAKGITDLVAAQWIRALDQAAATAPAPDLVWSGPEVPGVPARDTRRVYDELFTSATRSLWAVSYAYFDGPHVFGPLARRMEETPGLRVTLLLNIHRGQHPKFKRSSQSIVNARLRSGSVMITDLPGFPPEFSNRASCGDGC